MKLFAGDYLLEAFSGVAVGAVSSVDMWFDGWQVGMAFAAVPPPPTHACVYVCVFVPALCSTKLVPAMKQLLGQLITTP